MPGAHRHDDSRFCGATTTVIGQTNVYVNNKLWAVEGDPETHGNGNLVAEYGAKNVYINSKLVICAVGDNADEDDLSHPPTNTKPQDKSSDVLVYD
jgi:hypothetical protein